MPGSEAPIVSTEELAARLAGRGRPLWLVHATDGPAFRDGHIPGSLAAHDHDVTWRRAGLPVERSG